MSKSKSNTDCLKFGFDCILSGQKNLWMARPKPVLSWKYSNLKKFDNLKPQKSNEYNQSLKTKDIETSTANLSITVNATNSDANENSTAESYEQFLPPTDCRFRSDIRLLKLGNIG